jgi:hypothetical protein
MALDGDGSCTRHGCDMGTGSKALIVKHQLIAKDYSLGSSRGTLPAAVASSLCRSAPVFARPPLTPRVDHVLTVKPYSVKNLWVGRPAKTSARARQKVIAALIRWLRRWRAKYPNRPIYQDTPVTMNELRRLATKAGLTASDYTLKRQIASPAFRKWKGKPPFVVRKRKGKN